MLPYFRYRSKSFQANAYSHKNPKNYTKHRSSKNHYQGAKIIDTKIFMIDLKSKTIYFEEMQIFASSGRDCDIKKVFNFSLIKGSENFIFHIMDTLAIFINLICKKWQHIPN